MKRLLLFSILMSICVFTIASDQYITITAPAENESIDPATPISVSGTGKGLFEGNSLKEGVAKVFSPPYCGRRLG